MDVQRYALQTQSYEMHTKYTNEYAKISFPTLFYITLFIIQPSSQHTLPAARIVQKYLFREAHATSPKTLIKQK
jgi:hypothetical protein